MMRQPNTPRLYPTPWPGNGSGRHDHLISAAKPDRPRVDEYAPMVVLFALGISGNIADRPRAGPTTAALSVRAAEVTHVVPDSRGHGRVDGTSPAGRSSGAGSEVGPESGTRDVGGQRYILGSQEHEDPSKETQWTDAEAFYAGWRSGSPRRH
jgi:hypothetical protein